MAASSGSIRLETATPRRPLAEAAAAGEGSAVILSGIAALAAVRLSDAAGADAAAEELVGPAFATERSESVETLFLGLQAAPLLL